MTNVREVTSATGKAALTGKRDEQEDTVLRSVHSPVRLERD
jgi:hypothetical protein